MQPQASLNDQEPTLQSPEKKKEEHLGLTDSDKERIEYIEKMHTQDLPDDTKANLIELMNMGYLDFDKNLQMLKQANNNIETVARKYIGLSGSQV